MSIFFIADTHFGDQNIILFENRPFADTEMMEKAFIELWNATVTSEDTVFVWGILQKLIMKKTFSLSSTEIKFWLKEITTKKQTLITEILGSLKYTTFQFYSTIIGCCLMSPCIQA